MSKKEKENKDMTPDTEVLSPEEMGTAPEETSEEASTKNEAASEGGEEAVSKDDAVTDVLTANEKKNKDDDVTDVLANKEKKSDDEMTVPQKMGAKSEARKWAKESKAQDDIEEYKARKKEKEGPVEKAGPIKGFGLAALIIMILGIIGIGLIIAFYVIIPGAPVYKGAAAKGYSQYNMDGYVPAEPTVIVPTNTDAEEETTEAEPEKETPTDASDTDADNTVGTIGREV